MAITSAVKDNDSGLIAYTEDGNNYRKSATFKETIVSAILDAI